VQPCWDRNVATFPNAVPTQSAGSGPTCNVTRYGPAAGAVVIDELLELVRVGKPGPADAPVGADEFDDAVELRWVEAESLDPAVDRPCLPDRSTIAYTATPITNTATTTAAISSQTRDDRRGGGVAYVPPYGTAGGPYEAPPL
jgi:hypothetical protein